MRRTRAVVLVMCSVAIAVASWGSAATAGTAAKKKPKVSCDPKTAAADIGPLFDIEANSANSPKKQASVVQFGNQKVVLDTVKSIAASSPLKTVRAQPAANVRVLDKTSAVGDLNITVDTARLQVIHQGPQFYMCVGTDQNGTKKGAWRITLYSLCNLAALAPCSSAIITKGLNALTPVLQTEATKKG